MKNWILEKEGQLKLFIIVLSILLFTQTATARIVKQVNEKGEVTYINIEDKKTIQPQETQPEKGPFNIKDHPVFQKKETTQQAKPIQPQQTVTPINPYTKNKQTSNILATLSFCSFLIIVIPLSFFIIWMINLIDILKNEFTESNKIIWVLMITFIPFIGNILYWTIGKKQKIPHEEESGAN